VVSVLDSGAVWPGFKSQPRRCRVTVLGKLFTPIVPLFTKQQKLVAALLMVAEVTAGLSESNGSLPPWLWLTSPTGWLPRTGSSSGTLRSVVEYGLAFYGIWQDSTLRIISCVTGATICISYSTFDIQACQTSAYLANSVYALREAILLRSCNMSNYYCTESLMLFVVHINF